LNKVSRQDLKQSEYSKLKFEAMKIILPVTENQASGRSIARGFYKANLACIYNCNNQTSEWLPTNSISQNGGDLGDALKRIGIGAVISYQMPLMALVFFTDCGLIVYKAESENIEENIRMFTENLLEPLSNATSKIGSACSSSCNSCSSISCQS
jgi:predicted Fe-Mo cluster-binding NifX family protein